MLISNFQQFLRLLVPPLAVTGINSGAQRSVSASLESMAEALEPFRSMTIEQLAELLKVAQEFRVSGQLPDWIMAKQPKGPGRRPANARSAPKLSSADVVIKLRDLQERASVLTPGQISEEVQSFSGLTVSILKEVQLEFLGAAVGKTKAAILAEIVKKIDTFRASRDRVAGILSQ